MYVINVNDNKSKETHWVLLFADENTAVYFNSFEIEYFPQRVLNKFRDKSIMILLCADFVVSLS